MIYSIRRFLFVSLFVSITAASSVTAIGNYLLDKEILQPYLDSELIKVYNLIDRLYHAAPKSSSTSLLIKSNLKTSNTPNFMFQIWGNENKLLYHTANSSGISLKDTPNGFSNISIDNVDWRAYSGINPETHSKIVVAEVYNLRYELTDLITRNNAYILLVTFPIFAILIWVIIGIALRSVSRVTNEISNRASTYLEPVDESQVPIEIKPLVEELNQLFNRLKLTFERNKRFAADAAHELRTPLAALKTQAQVALKAESDSEKQIALQKVIQGVDRSSHVVTQLLTLSRLRQEKDNTDIQIVDLHKLATEIIAYLVPLALEKNVDIELLPPPNDVMIAGNDTTLGILIRNVVDNAIRYTPENGAVKIEIKNQNKKIILSVTDTGTGIPKELHERVFERFYRVIGTNTTGSGLGLAIVSQIAKLYLADISLSTPPNGIGLQFDVAFPIVQESPWNYLNKKS